MQARTVENIQGTGDWISIAVLELMAMVVAAYVIVVMTGGRLGREGDTAFMRENISSAVRWMMYCRGEEGRAGDRGAGEDDGCDISEGRLALPRGSRKRGR